MTLPASQPLVARNLPRAAKSPAHFTPLLAYGLRFGRLLTTAGEPRGASAWLPPGETEVTEARMQETGLDKLPELRGEAAAARFFGVLGAVEPFYKTDMPPDHWHLFVVGVDPIAQGRGLARPLLAPVLEAADRNGHPCYLETAQPANVGLYAHLGCHVLRDVVDDDSGLRLWTFRRDPPAVRA
jgi:GNAT superfamily N-acetyltransferase